MVTLLNIQRRVFEHLLTCTDDINLTYKLNLVHSDQRLYDIEDILLNMRRHTYGVCPVFIDPSVVEHYEYVHPHLFLYFTQTSCDYVYNNLHVLEIFESTNPVFIAWHNKYCETWNLDAAAMMECIRVGDYLQYIASVSTPVIYSNSPVVQILNELSHISLYDITSREGGFITNMNYQISQYRSTSMRLRTTL